MAGPLNGIGGQQQIPLATPFQPGQSAQQVRPEDRQPQSNAIQPRNAAAAGTQQTSTDNSRDVLRAQSDDSSRRSNDNQQTRGSVLDITV